MRIPSKDPNVAALADGLAKPVQRNLITINAPNPTEPDFFILGLLVEDGLTLRLLTDQERDEIA